MKIVEQTDRTLQITDQNRQCFWGLLFAAPFIAIGLGSIALTAKVITLECQRHGTSQIECQRSIAGILGTEKDRIPGNLISAKTVKTSGRGAVITTTEGEIELATYRAFVTDRVDRTVDRLNVFIKDPQQTKLEIEQDDRWANSLWSINFLIAGMAIAVGALAIPLRMSCRFDRQRGAAIVDKKYLLYGDRQIEIPFATIVRAEVDSLFFRINSKSVYNIYLVTDKTKKISLSVISQDLSHYQEVARVVNHFLQT